MASVRRTIVISEAQDRYLSEIGERHDIKRTRLIRMALDKFMRDPPFFGPANLANSKENAHLEQAQEITR